MAHQSCSVVSVYFIDRNILNTFCTRNKVHWSFQIYLPINADIFWQHTAHVRSALQHFIESNITQTNSFPKWFVPKFHACYFRNFPPPQKTPNRQLLRANQHETTLSNASSFLWIFLRKVTSNEKSQHHLKLSNNTF